MQRTIEMKPRCFGKLHEKDAIECSVCEYVKSCALFDPITVSPCSEAAPEKKKSKRGMALDLVNELLSNGEYTTQQLVEVAATRINVCAAIVRKIVADLKISGVLSCRVDAKHRFYKMLKK